MSIEGTTVAASGTSVVSPLYAGLIAVLNALAGYRAGTLNPLLYASASPVIVRNIADEVYNGVPGITGYYAMPGWNAVTGLGSLRGNGLLSVLRGSGCAGMTWKGVNGDQGIYHAVIGAGPWSPPRALPGIGSSDGPVAATAGGADESPEGSTAITMVWKGIAGDPGIYLATYDGVRWTAQSNQDGLATSAAPGLTGTDQGSFMAWVGQTPGDETVYWTDDEGIVLPSTPPTPVSFRDPRRLLVRHAGPVLQREHPLRRLEGRDRRRPDLVGLVRHQRPHGLDDGDPGARRQLDQRAGDGDPQRQPLDGLEGFRE